MKGDGDEASSSDDERKPSPFSNTTCDDMRGDQVGTGEKNQRWQTLTKSPVLGI